MSPTSKTKAIKPVDISFNRTCSCPPNHINCLEPRDWLKHQLGVWQFNYEKRDIRKRDLHPATYPLALSSKCISLFTHEGELVLDPFVGSGTTLLSSQDLNRNAVGFDLSTDYIALSNDRVKGPNTFDNSKQIAIQDEAMNIDNYLEPGSVSLIMTSPPYANLLNRKRLNKSRRGDERQNDQYLQIEQYSQDPRDLGTMDSDAYTTAIGETFELLLPLLKPKGHCVINVPDFWFENKRITVHISVVEELRKRGYELRNTIIWDRTNIVNRIGIFGWPSNYITMGTTFEYLLDFWKPEMLVK